MFKWRGQFVSTVQKGEQKSQGRATSRCRSQPLTPGEREKEAQINVCIHVATNKCTISTKTSSVFLKEGDQNVKRTEETHRQRAGQDQIWSASEYKQQSYTVRSGLPVHHHPEKKCWIIDFFQNSKYLTLLTCIDNGTEGFGPKE